MKLLTIIILSLTALHTHAQVDRPAVIDIQKVINGAIDIRDSNSRKVIYTKLDSLKILAAKWDAINSKMKACVPYSLQYKAWKDSLARFTAQNISILSRIKMPE